MTAALQVLEPWMELERLRRENAELRAREEEGRLEMLRLKLAAASFKELAFEDDLTGLGSKRAFSRVLEAEAARSARTLRPFALVMLDVDHFKAINDSCGHEGGDEVLRNVGRAILRSVRVTDIATRWGGEEFALVLPETTLEAATVVTGRVLEAVRELAGVTISAGVSAWPDSARDAYHLRLEADAALYRAKKAGRDRLELAL